MSTRLLPNWIQAYLAYTDESESPEEYHKWVAISTIAGAMRRRSFYNYGYFLAYPNMYIVLVGPAGRCKKSTAMRIGRSMLSEVKDVNFTTDSITRERLIQDLSQSNKDGHSTMTAYSSEFASLLTSSGMDMVVFLTDIFDSPPEWSHKTKIGGTNKIKGPCLNMCGATTPDWIAKAMPLDTVGIGLTSRIIFVYQDTPRVKDPFPELNEKQKIIREALVKDLASISLVNGEYTWESEATKNVYREWYKSRIQDPNPTGDPRLNGYYERKPVHLLKLCMIIAASFRDEPIIKESDFKDALILFDQIEAMMPRVFANVGKNPLSVDYDDIAAVVAQHPQGIKLGQLMRMFKHSVDMEQLDKVMMALAVMGKVIAGNGQTYFPPKE